MLVSLDGKIDGAFFQAPQTAPALKAYGELRGHYGCAATLYGTATMLGGYADGRVSAAETDGGAPDPGDWVNADGRAMGNFIVSLDPCGELAFPGPVLEKKGRVSAHVVQALTRRAAPATLPTCAGAGCPMSLPGTKALTAPCCWKSSGRCLASSG